MASNGMLYRWQGGSRQDHDGPATHLAKELRVAPLVAHLLCRRGLHESTAAQPFLHPKLTHLHDPVRLPGLLSAAERLVKAVRDGQPIVIYGDYDVDGVTASAILWHVLKLAGADVSTYVPHRIDEGYGLNTEALLMIGRGEHNGERSAAGRRPLIVSVDCGITALAPAAAAADAGIELIITDHHEFDDNALPRAVALVHPRLGVKGQGPAEMGQGPRAEGRAKDIADTASPIALPLGPGPSSLGPSLPYPFPDLCGAGVAFKLAWQFAKVFCGRDRVPENYRALLLDLLSLAALGTVADIVPLVGENRVITTFGLGQIKRTGITGLNALIDSANLRDEKIDSYHVGFVLGPRLNACGRMGHAADALRLLTTAGPDEAAAIAGQLTKANDSRRATERQIAEQARAMVRDCGYDHCDSRAIVLGCEGWHAGVIGIVASRIVEEFHRPAILLNFDGDEAHGSARSVSGVSIHEALHHCAAHLTSFGGHAMAAGLRLPRANVDAFREALVAFVNDRLNPADLTPVLDIDADCDLPEVTLEMVEQVQCLAPFGRENPAPVLCVKNVQLAEAARRIGNGGKHLRLNLRHERVLMQAVGFGLGDLAEQLPAGARIDVAFEPKVNTWQGRKRPDMHVMDLRLRSEKG